MPFRIHGLGGLVSFSHSEAVAFIVCLVDMNVYELIQSFSGGRRHIYFRISDFRDG